MEMQGSRQLAVTQRQAWDALNDPEVLKACIPGCDKVEATGEGQYAIGMSVKVGRNGYSPYRKVCNRTFSSAVRFRSALEFKSPIASEPMPRHDAGPPIMPGPMP